MIVWIKLDDHTLNVGIILQVCAACPTVLFPSVCCLHNCIICKCVLPAQLYYLQVCAACPTVIFPSVCCLPNCNICKCVLPAQLYYFASVCCLPNCNICKCVLPAQLPVLFRKFRTPSIRGNNIHGTFPTGTWPDTTKWTHPRTHLMMDSPRAVANGSSGTKINWWSVHFQLELNILRL
jgi:hypothetical protein